jgi:uracil-DNA glycosylase
MKTIAQLRNEIQEMFNAINCKLMDFSITDKIIKNGVGFFPYGSGLLGSDKDTLPQEGIMLVGQDFGTLGYLTHKIISDGEVGNKTYDNLLKIIPDELKTKVFLTNLLMGVRKPPAKMTGKNPVLLKPEENRTYLDACFTFFEKQIMASNPRLIIVLGSEPFKAILKYYERSNFTNFRKYSLNDTNHAIGVNGKEYRMIVIPHPSMWHFNLKKEGIDELIQFIIDELK